MSGKPGRSGRPEGSADFRDLPAGEIPEMEAAVLTNRFIRKMTLADSAIQAGYSAKDREAAKNIGNRIVRRHRDANSEFIKALERVGVNAEKIAQVIADGLKAETAVKRGSDYEMVPDCSTRHKFAETVLDILGGRAPKMVEVEAITFEERLARITLTNGEPREKFSRDV